MSVVLRDGASERAPKLNFANFIGLSIPQVFERPESIRAFAAVAATNETSGICIISDTYQTHAFHARNDGQLP